MKHPSLRICLTLEAYDPLEEPELPSASAARSRHRDLGEELRALKQQRKKLAWHVDVEKAGRGDRRRAAALQAQFQQLNTRIQDLETQQRSARSKFPGRTIDPKKREEHLTLSQYYDLTGRGR